MHQIKYRNIKKKNVLRTLYTVGIQDCQHFYQLL